MDGNLLSEGGFIVADNVAYKGALWAADESYGSAAAAIDAFNRAVR